MNKRMQYLAFSAVLTLIPLKSYAQGIEMTSGGTITVTGAATIDISDGGIINNGTYTKGTETVTLSGTTAKSISGANALTVNNLVISSTGTISLDNSVTAATMTINPNAKVTNASGKTLAGTTLNIKSDATGTGTYVDWGTATTFGTTNVEQYLTGAGTTAPSNRFWYISSPLESASASAFAVNPATSRLWYYNQPTHAYVDMNGTEPLGVGRGYVSRLISNRTITLTGGNLNKVDQAITLSKTDGNTKTGYNLVGNPFPSFVSLDYAVDGENAGIESTIWYRSLLASGSGMAFDTYNILTHAYILTQSGSGNPTDYIAPMQAFWVKALANNNTVSFRQANRSHNATVKLRNAELSDVENIRIQVSNGTASDETLIGFYPNAMDAFEPHDSHKFSNDNLSMPEVFTFAGTEELAINGLAPITDSKELALGFRPGKAGTYTLKASELLNLTEGTKVFLKDKRLDVVQDLTQAPDYTFTSDAVTTTDRFSIVISKIATSLAVTAGKPSFTTYAEQNGQVHVQLQNIEMKGTRINVYSVSGQLLVTRPAVETNTSFHLNLPNGLYLIEVSQEGFVGRKKIVLNN